MTRERSEEITARIATMIANEAPYIDYTPKDLKNARKDAALRQQFESYCADGILPDDFELFFVFRRFADALKLTEAFEGRYLQQLYRNARKFSVSEFYENPYMRHIQVPTVRIGNYLLTTAAYDRGEFFQYDMPDFSAPLLVPSLGFFPGKITFPSIYEDNIPWMSVCPSEISSMQQPIAQAHGNVLVLGLGLGYYPLMISEKEEVSTITIIEIQPEIIQLFKEHLLPQFPHKDKIRIITADAFRYLSSVSTGDYDFCFADIWENQIDGAKCYVRIKEEEKRLVGTEFSYWIEDSIRWQLNE